MDYIYICEYIYIYTWTLPFPAPKSHHGQAAHQGTIPRVLAFTTVRLGSNAVFSFKKGKELCPTVTFHSPIFDEFYPSR